MEGYRMMKKILLGLALLSQVALGEGRIKNSDIASNAAIDPAKIASGNWTGNAATATALASDPVACSANQYVTDIAANGTLTCNVVDGLPSQTGNSGKFLTTNGSAASWDWAATSLTGDVTGSVSGSAAVATTIANDAVTNAKAANMAQATLKGRASGAGTGDPTDLTGTQATAILDTFTGDSGSGGVKGLVPAPSAGDAAAGYGLKADGTWGTVGTASPLTTKGDLYTWSTTNARLPVGSNNYLLTPDSAETTGLKWTQTLPTGAVPAFSGGDVTSAGGSLTLTIPNDTVTYAKMQNISATDRLLGRDTAGAGDTEELTVGGGVEFTGSGGIQRSALTGDVTASAGSASTTIADDAVTNAKAANMAQSTIKGRAAGAGTGDPTDLTATQATAILDAFTGDSGSGGVKGLVPAPTAGEAAAGEFLSADGTFKVTGNQVITDWAAYTPTFTAVGTATNISFFWRRVGDTLQIHGKFTSGTTAASEARISLPNSYIIDSTKIASLRHVGRVAEGTAGAVNAGTLAEPNVSYVVFGYQYSGSAELVKRNGNDIFSAGSDFSVDASIPISGWSSGGGSGPTLQVSDWSAITITPSAAFGTVSNNSWQARRVGDTLEVRGYFTAGTVAGSTASLDIGTWNGLSPTIDTAKMGTAINGHLGICYELISTGVFRRGESNVDPIVFFDGSDTNTVFLSIASGSSTTFTKNIGSDMQGNGGGMPCYFKFPVSGWTSTTTGSTTAPRSHVFLDTPNGHGATNTKVRRYTNTRSNTGDFTVADDANAGGSVTLQTAGVYVACITDDRSGGATNLGVTVNGSALTTAISSTTYAQGRRLIAYSPAASFGGGCTPPLPLAAGDIIRATTDGDPDCATARCYFSVTKVSN